MSEFRDVKFSSLPPRVPLGPEHDVYPHSTVICPRSCGYIVRVRTDQSELTLEQHREWCPKA